MGTMAHNKNGFDFFKFYRFLSHYIFLILITIFADNDFDSVSVPKYADRNLMTFGRDLGTLFFVWSWLGAIIAPCAFIVVMAYSDSTFGDSNRDIVDYFINNQSAEAEQLLMFGVNPKVDENDNNILHGLCKYGRIKCMVWMKKYCKANKEYINAKNNKGYTPIMTCANPNPNPKPYNEKEKPEREEIILFLLQQKWIKECDEYVIKNAQKVDDDEKKSE